VTGGLSIYCAVFKNTRTVLHAMVPTVIDEWIGNGCGIKWSLCCPLILPEEIRKTTISIS
jgi:hypothetical protein